MTSVEFRLLRKFATQPGHVFSRAQLIDALCEGQRRQRPHPGFDWDAGNAAKNAAQGMSQSDAKQAIANAPLLTLEDARHSHSEARYHALGQTDTGRRLHVTFTLRTRDTLIRVIAARDMHRKERARYEQEIEANP